MKDQSAIFHVADSLMKPGYYITPTVKGIAGHLLNGKITIAGHTIRHRADLYEIPHGYKILCIVANDLSTGESMLDHHGHVFVYDLLEIDGKPLDAPLTDRLDLLAEVLEPFVSEPYVWISACKAAKGVFLPHYYNKRIAFPALWEQIEQYPIYNGLMLRDENAAPGDVALIFKNSQLGE